MLKDGFRKCLRRPQHRLPLGCEPHEWLVAASTVSDVVSGVQNATEQCISRFQLIDAVHTRACTGIKNAHNSVTVQNRTHVYMNFFHHKDLGNHLLQLCPKVVKHPVYIILQCNHLRALKEFM